MDSFIVRPSSFNGFNSSQYAPQATIQTQIINNRPISHMQSMQISNAGNLSQTPTKMVQNYSPNQSNIPTNNYIILKSQPNSAQKQR